MQNLSPSLRKAAVLVSALDRRTADALLAQMGDEDAARVRSALVELDEIPATEQESVLAEFLAGKSAAGNFKNDDQGVELDVSNTSIANDASASGTPSPEQDQLFAFLGLVSPEVTARLLVRESAQTIALVVSRLAPHLAACLLEALPTDLATDALARMADLSEPASEVLAEIADHLRRELAPLAMHQRAATSLADVQALLAAMQATSRDRVLARLQHRDGWLAERLGFCPQQSPNGPARFRVESADYSQPATMATAGKETSTLLIEFDDLVALGDEVLRRVFAAVHPQVVLLALTGAPESLLARILDRLPAGEAATLRTRLNCPGPVRLSDIAAAQDELAAAARRLAALGKISLPSSRHFAAAA